MGSDDNGGSGERFLVRRFVDPDGARIAGRTPAFAASPAPATGRETRGSNGAACPADEDAPRPRPSSPHRTLGKLCASPLCHSEHSEEVSPSKALNFPMPFSFARECGMVDALDLAYPARPVTTGH